jgi:hypothetical protein
LKVYTASKLSHASRWVVLAHELAPYGVTITSRWIKYSHALGDRPYESEAVLDGETMRQCWIEDHEDVSRADVVLVYGEPGENLRGALVEAGMGIALGKTVLVVGENENFGTWHHHPRCKRLETLEDAKRILTVANGSTRTV